jgi:diguanylate cyclase (GGDEF)-like protein/PAS domain S-box-containing protein
MSETVSHRVLLIENNSADAGILMEMLSEQEANPALVQVRSMVEAETRLLAGGFDVVLLDLDFPEAELRDAMRRLHAAAPHVPLLALMGADDQALASQALEQGAQDCLVMSSLKARGLQRAIRHAAARKHMEQALFSEVQRAQVALGCVGYALICVDVEGRVTSLNEVAQTLTGWSAKEARGRPLAEVFEKRRERSDRTASIAHEGEPPPLRADGILVRRDGTETPIEDSVGPTFDREGQSTGKVVVFRDVRIARAPSIETAQMVEHDALTGLANRRLLSERIAGAISLAKRHDARVALLFLDLDGFKQINASLGHAVGDKLLRALAIRLQTCARASDTVSRQGKGEFVVLLSEMAHTDDASRVACRILDSVAEPFYVDQHRLHVTGSIGVSVYPEDGQDAETLIRNADAAMYQAKENGREGYHYFKPVMNARAVERQTVEAGLRRALERDQFALHYLPKVNLTTGALGGAEALLRWTHPSRGPVPTSQIISVAEECGLILPIGNWVLRQACEQAKLWRAAGLPLTSIAVNVSAREFRSPDYLTGLFAILDETGLDPTALELEMTESVLMNHAGSSTSVLRALRDRGIKLAIDDFGTGYSSLDYLRRFPVDTLKIDGSFVAQIGDALHGGSVVDAVFGIARSLGLNVAAEGVETLSQLTFLQDRGCDEAQGFYFSSPVQPQRFAELLRAGLATPIQRRSATAFASN